MTFDLKHWNNPRGTIANKFVNNDFAYVSRGAKDTIEVLSYLNILPEDAKHMTILDYGCGTGRVSTFLSYMFKQVIGYDPNPNCITEALNENRKSDINRSNLFFTSNINEITTICDYSFSINVIEHLDDKDANVMIDNLKRLSKNNPLIWYHTKRNTILKPYIVGSTWEDKAKLATNIQIDFFDFNS